MASVGPRTTVEDRVELASFLRDVQSLLPETLEDHAEWFLTELRAPLLDAWRDLEPSFEMAIRYLDAPPDPNLVDAQLAHVGLTGNQLEAKLAGFRQAFVRLGSVGTKRAFRSVLGWTNIILGTLAGVVPGAEAIKEYKEAYEQSSEDADEDANTEEPEPGRFRPPARFSI